MHNDVTKKNKQFLGKFGTFGGFWGIFGGFQCFKRIFRTSVLIFDVVVKNFVAVEKTRKQVSI